MADNKHWVLYATKLKWLKSVLLLNHSTSEMWASANEEKIKSLTPFQ